MILLTKNHLNDEISFGVDIGRINTNMIWIINVRNVITLGLKYNIIGCVFSGYRMKYKKRTVYQLQKTRFANKNKDN